MKGSLFNVGDVVVLEGGERMTVVANKGIQGDTWRYKCGWFEKDVYHTYIFVEGDLTKIDEEEDNKE